MIGIITALALEAEKLISESENTVTEEVTGLIFHKITINKKEAVVAVCGVGKVNAARCAEAMILKYSPDIIINTGVGGALDESLNIGDIVVSESVTQHDMDTSPLGDPLGFLSTPPLVFIPADQVNAEILCENASELGLTAVKGIIASGDQFICTPEKKDFIKSNFGAIVCEMEGAAIGHVCYLSGVPFVVLRAISDGSNDNSAIDVPTFAKMAADNSASLLKTLF
jgi:adenosylhomocysteine nucleosidase